MAVGCKPVRVVVAVDVLGAEDGHARSLPAAELPALAQRYAANVGTLLQQSGLFLATTWYPKGGCPLAAGRRAASAGPALQVGILLLQKGFALDVFCNRLACSGQLGLEASRQRRAVINNRPQGSGLLQSGVWSASPHATSVQTIVTCVTSATGS